MGLDFPEMLTLILIVFKVTNYINWSWWLVFAPVILFYGMALFLILIIIFIFIMKSIWGWFDYGFF